MISQVINPLYHQLVLPTGAIGEICVIADTKSTPNTSYFCYKNYHEYGTI